MKRPKIPAHIIGPFASYVEGSWKQHLTSDAVWRRVWRYRADDSWHAVRVVAPGRGEPLEMPATRPPGGSTSGKGSSRNPGLRPVTFLCSDQERQSYEARSRASEMSRSEWIRERLRD